MIILITILKRGALLAKESNKTLDEGDLVRTRIVAISLKDNSTKNTKIGLTMRQNNLGRFEWIEEAKIKIRRLNHECMYSL